MDKKAHAKHNEDACNFLHSHGDYCDWVVTTAFYSALHLVQYEVFPKIIAGFVYNTFDEYYNGDYKGTKNKPSKHTATINLVRAELGDSAFQLYNWLFGLCMNARYHDYKVHKFIADEAVNRLSRLKIMMKK
ncbi:hypothetical protein DHW03_07150 [Pedobacter yonginense]|uniref:Uncharacterized protein n=1 Tax=Pedobacter yonginense TaxID=651869 RepID=A0A317ELX4_9SPHI|nr:hypothetical protein [Pedobacter yonginense]PWS27385.1 hypothetical protein DHW03_07150 [Pedobacter yonginense]